jgi:hypothetical protein
MWTLILLIHAGALSGKDSAALTTVNFKTQAACMQAGAKTAELVRLTVKEARFVCVENEK